MSWIPLDHVITRIKNRKWFWSGCASHLKYINVRIDTRDDHAIVLDRDGKIVARDQEEFDQLFDELDAQAEKLGGYSLKSPWDHR